MHYVASELSRRGLIALPTTKNLPAFDILVANVEGTRHANIQVKASSKRAGFFPMPPPEKVKTGRHDFYVMVRWLEDEGRYEGFLLTGRQAKKAVEETCKWQTENIARGSRNKIFPTVNVTDARSPDAGKWRKAWIEWRL